MKNLRAINELKAKKAQQVLALQNLAVKAAVSPLDGADVGTYENLKTAIIDIDSKIADMTKFNIDDANSFTDTNDCSQIEGFLSFARSGDMAGVSMKSVENGSIIAMDRGAASGGALVPKELADAIWKNAVDSYPLIGLCTTMSLTTEKDIPISGNKPTWSWVAEKSKATESDITTSKKTLKAYKAMCLTKASWELINDSKFDIESYIKEQAGESLGEFSEDAYLNGGSTETTKPCGIKASAMPVDAAAVGKVTYSDISRLYMSPKQQNRAMGHFVASKNAIINIMTLVDDSKRPIFTPSYAVGQPDMLLGRPLLECSHLTDTIGDILFGNFKNYIIGNRQDMIMQRLAELYATEGMIGLLFHMRTDGQLMDDKSISKLILKTA